MKNIFKRKEKMFGWKMVIPEYMWKYDLSQDLYPGFEGELIYDAGMYKISLKVFSANKENGVSYNQYFRQLSFEEAQDWIIRKLKGEEQDEKQV